MPKLARSPVALTVERAGVDEKVGHCGNVGSKDGEEGKLIWWRGEGGGWGSCGCCGWQEGGGRHGGLGCGRWHNGGGGEDWEHQP